MIPIIFVIIYSLFQFIESKRLKLNIVTIFSFFIIFCSFLIIVINIDSIIYVYNRNVIAYLEHAGGVNQDSNLMETSSLESPFFYNYF